MTNVVCPDCGPACSCAPSSSSYFRSEGKLIRRFGRMVRLHTGRSICLYGAFPADGPCPPGQPAKAPVGQNLLAQNRSAVGVGQTFSHQLSVRRQGVLIAAQSAFWAKLDQTCRG